MAQASETRGTLVDNLLELATPLWFTDQQYPFIPAVAMRREIEQETVENGAEMAGDRFQAILTVLDEFDYDVPDSAVDEVANEFIRLTGMDDTISAIAAHIKRRDMSQAPDANPQQSPPAIEAVGNAVNVGGLFVGGDFPSHLLYERPVAPPSYFAGKFTAISASTFGGQVFWGRGIFSDPDMQMWFARAASIATIEYYNSFVPTLESVEPWTAILNIEAAGETGKFDRMAVDEDAHVLKLLSGIGHWALLLRVLQFYQPLPPLPNLDLPLPDQNLVPTFQSKL